MKKMKYIMVISFMSMMSIVSAQTRDTVPQINKKVPYMKVKNLQNQK